MSSQVETQTQEAQRAPNEATADSGSEDEAVALFNQRAQSQAQNEPETPEDEPQDDRESEPEEGEPDSQVDAAEKLVEVEYEGETHKLSPKLKDALLRQADYSRNMGALAESKKDYAQRIESATKLIEGAEKFAEVIAEGKQLELQIKQFEGVDWKSLRSTDPAQAALMAVELMELRQARVQLDSKAQAIDRDLADGRSKDQTAKQAEMLKTLAKEFPGWGDEAGAKVTNYAIKSGFTTDEVRNFTDPRLVLALEKARKFDAIQDGKKNALAQTRDVPPVARPGAPRRSAPAVDAQTRFQKSTSPDDAVALFEARAAVRRR